MTKNEYLLIEDWIKYHGYLFGYENLYIIDASTDVRVLDVYKKYQNYGLNLIYDKTDLNNLEKQLTFYMSKFGGEDSFLIKLDTDEFLAYNKNGYLDNKNIRYLFDFLPVTGQKYKASYVISSIAQSDSYDRPCIELESFTAIQETVFKSYFHSKSFISVDLGSHAGQAVNNEGYIGTVLSIIHYHDLGNKIILERTKNVLLSHNYINEEDDLDVQLQKLSKLVQLGNVSSVHKIKIYLRYLESLKFGFKLENISNDFNPLANNNDTIIRGYLIKNTLQEIDSLQKLSNTTKLSIMDIKQGSTPLVTICIPVYNGGQFLEESLDSVLTQTYHNIEIILSDDNSGDNSLEIAKKYQSKCDKNFVILLHKPCGMVQNWNFCAEHTKGKYIKFLHQDDVLEPDCIEKMVALAEQDNEVGLVFSPRGIIASNEAQNDPVCQADIQHSQNLYTAWKNLQPIQAGKTLLLAPNILDNPINKIGEPTTVLIRKEVFDNIGFFDTELCQLVDVEMWFRIMSQYKIGFVDQILSHWRIHSQQQTRSNSKNRERILLDWKKFYQKIFENEIYPTQLREKVALVLGYTTNSSNQEGLLSKPQNVTQQWLEISEENLESAFSGELGNKHRELLALGIKQLLLSSEEKQFIVELNQYIAKGWKQDKIAQHFLAANLYCYPHQLPERWFENAEVPEFLVDYFVNFMFETPSFFKELGEADQYYRYVKDWVNFLHLCITTEIDSPIWQQMAWIFTQRANFIPLYFNSQNLKEIYVKRAEIMEIALKQQGFQLNSSFSPRDKNRKKIRVGFLSNHFTPQTETFSTLPAFEHLDRGFEVILYANMTNGHPLEKYCESRVDRLVQLPEDLNAKVQMIRQDDLDFLFICTNTTAVTNQITILALHKLARVQIATFNSPVTTGMKNIDYYLTGKLTEFENSEHYSENLLLLNGQGYCFNYGDNEPKPTQTFTRQLFGIKEDQIIFISAANFYKLTPELKETWVKILAKVDNSVLILMPFGQSWSNQYPKESLVKSLHLLFEKYNISTDRLKFFDPLPNRIEVREALKIADVYLDSYPYSGTTSLIEPLEIGLPSVVRQGNTLRNRMGAAMLQSINLNDLVVENEESYINLAVKLGTDEKLRKQYREQILEKMANNPPFLDSRSYSAQIGDVLKQLFEKHL